MQLLYLLPSVHSETFGSIIEQLLDSNKEKAIYVLEVIARIRENNGHPQMPLAKCLKGVDGQMNEIRVPYGRNELLRVYYFIDYENDAMVLLNGIIKPDGRNKSSSYEKKAGKKLNKAIEKSIQLALQFKAAYHYSHPDYESFIN
ncbi:MAG: hypothetical protein KAS32_01530 [Candidatus Peribacteraceae bacterium]|nr:hypothetical protein [Candidatus Peribacteraceae bacterium]